jgi:uncharacterized protein (DUF2141 family)
MTNPLELAPAPLARSGRCRLAARSSRRARHWLAAPALLGLAVCTEAPPAAAAADSPEIVMVGRVPRERGHLRCGVYDRDGWLKRPLRSAEAVPTGFRGVCRFPSLTPGTYALGAYLDENDNGDLDRDFVGYPSEPYAVSNGARVRMLSPPSFDAAKVDYRGGELTVQLQLE